jgi:hypothetical protein
LALRQSRAPGDPVNQSDDELQIHHGLAIASLSDQGEHIGGMFAHLGEVALGGGNFGFRELHVVGSID